MRELTDEFMWDLRDVDGRLYPLLKRIKQDHTLMLSIRKDYINIYYRGGSILKLEKLNDGYCPYFNPKYNKLNIPIPRNKRTIRNINDTDVWLNAFRDLKRLMDSYYSGYFINSSSNPEREFQQLIARENNYSTLSRISEYFITDIEFEDTDIGARLDILALQWLSTHRKKIDRFRPVFIEMKYGDDALKEHSGLIEHLEDVDELISDNEKYQSLCKTMEIQFNQLDKLGLMKFKKVANWKDIEVNREEIPEVICILSNHNPRSKILGKILNDPSFDKFANSPKYELKFHISSFSGYALHADCMVSLEKFRKLVNINYMTPK